MLIVSVPILMSLSPSHSFFPSRDSLGEASRTMPLTPAQGRETV